MRQIILDTETTGLDPEDGHKIIEIGGVELVDRFFTGNNFHKYINPEREVGKEAQAIHGITNDFLMDKPLFSEIKNDFIEYIKGAELIIHNAPFDVGFINYEFKLIDINSNGIEYYANVFDTLKFARKKHPGKKNNLDALCKRYNVDNTKRELHGALLDAQLLAEVYLYMTGGQLSLFEEESNTNSSVSIIKKTWEIKKSLAGNLPLRVIYASSEEEKEHQYYLELIKQKSEENKCLWLI